MANPAASNKINVAIRIRPFSKRENDMGTRSILNIESNQAILQHPKGLKEGKVFAFDHCFASHTETCQDEGGGDIAGEQRRVFERIGLDIITNAFLGYNACVFAYGQTGSGKSYTMMGTPDNKGIIPRLCEELFARIESTEISTQNQPIKYKVEVSYIEIYNERVHDLLDPSGGAKKSLKVREHNLLGPYVENLTILAVTSFADISLLISEGNKSRTVAATNMNTESSRSHAVFSIRMTQSSLDSEGQITGEKVSKISLVDLAGSERVSKSGAAGERLKEGSNINKSLTTLGLVISTLADQSTGKVKSKFIPYRDSALTWLLKDNLGGNSLTTMVATLSPSSDNYEETLSTLRYADRAKRILNHAVVNEDPRAKVIRELKEEVEALKAQLGRQMETSSLKERLKQSEDLMQELEMPWEAKLAISEKIQQERQKALENIGISVDDSGIKMQNDQYYLVNLNSDPSFTEMLVYYLKQSRILIGRPDAEIEQHIKLQGLGIMSQHCYIDIVSKEGVCTGPGDEFSTPGVYITPMLGAPTCVNGVAIYSKTALHHGDRILWGYYHFFRLNCPVSSKSNGLPGQGGDNDLTTTAVANGLPPPDPEGGGDGLSLSFIDPYTSATQELAMNQPWFNHALAMNQLYPFSPLGESTSLSQCDNRDNIATNRTPSTCDKAGKRVKRPDSWDDSSIRSWSLGRTRRSDTHYLTPSSSFSFNTVKSPKTKTTASTVKSSKYDAAHLHQKRSREFRKSLDKLKEQIVHANLLVREANSIATELGVDVSYSAILQIPEDKLKVMNRSKEGGSVFCESAIVVKRSNYPHYVWSMGKFENKIYEMRELYHESKNDPLQEVTNRGELFYDVNYTNVLLGVGNVYLECLKHDIRFDYKVPIINQQGQIAGKLTVAIFRSEYGPNTFEADKDMNYSFTGRRVPFSTPNRCSLVNSSSSSSLLNSANATGPLLMSESLVSTDSGGVYCAPSATINAKVEIKDALELQITRQDSVYLQYEAPQCWQRDEPGRAVRSLKESVQAPTPYLVVEKKFRKKRKTPSTQASQDGSSVGNGKVCAASNNLAARIVKFKHENVVALDLPENGMEALNDSVLSIEVWCRRKLRKNTEPVPSSGSTMGRRGSCSTPIAPVNAALEQAIKKHPCAAFQQPSSLVKRWHEVKKRLEFWVTIAELNEGGEYVNVEVVPRNPCLVGPQLSHHPVSFKDHINLVNGTGGVYQLKQGRQRRISVELKVTGGGNLPLMCEGVKAMHIGSILVSPSFNEVSAHAPSRTSCDQPCDAVGDIDILDSYQEEGLEILRAKWSAAVEARRQYLDSHLQKKSKKDLLREQSLVDQWLTLTEERNALLVPSSGTEIPGSPADTEPPVGMEKHVPVIFLDTYLPDLNNSHSHVSGDSCSLTDNNNNCDMRQSFLSDFTSDDNIPSFINGPGVDVPESRLRVIGAESCLMGENDDSGQASPLPYQYHNDAYFPLKIAREYRTTSNSLVSVASWDSSVHDSPHLNRCTTGDEKVYLILKILVKLSHPVPIFVWLRKRLCLTVGNPKISLGEKILRRIRFTDSVVDRCGVTYEIVSNIPEDSKELEARENLAVLAANASRSSTEMAVVSPFERSSCSDNDEENCHQFKGMYDALRRRIGGHDGYINTYVQSISTLQSLLTFDKLRQEVVVREKLSKENHGIHKTISVPDLYNAVTPNVNLAIEGRRSEAIRSLRSAPTFITERHKPRKSRPGLGHFLESCSNGSSLDAIRQRSLTPLIETNMCSSFIASGRTPVSHSLSSHELNFCTSPSSPSDFNAWKAGDDQLNLHENGVSPLSAPNPPLFWNMKPLKTVLEEIHSSTGTAPPNSTN